MGAFSRRYGYTEDKVIQSESIDADLKTGLWNALCIHFYEHTEASFSGEWLSDKLTAVLRQAWIHFYKWPISDMTAMKSQVMDEIGTHFEKAQWFEVYDLIEFMAPLADKISFGNTAKFVAFCNDILEAERSAHRFVGMSLAPIVNGEEISEVEAAIRSPHDSIRLQITAAVEKLSQKPQPDLRGSIKESISAVETAVKLIDGKPSATLPGAIARLKQKVDLHQDLEKGFKSLYNYTSDSDGIRHGLMEKSDLTPDDARYMLVSCSAFANYLLRLAGRAGLVIAQA